MTMTRLDGLLDAIVSDPLSEDRWEILADWLEEHDDPRRAELLRLHRKLLAGRAPLRLSMPAADAVSGRGRLPADRGRRP